MDIDTEVETLSAIYGDDVTYEDNTLCVILSETVEDNAQVVEGKLTIKFSISEDFPEVVPSVDKIKDSLIEIIRDYTVFLSEEALRIEKQEEDERERQFIGSAKKTFNEWWKDKEKERKMILQQIKQEKDDEAQRKKGRLTGKQFFLNNPQKLIEQGVDLELFTDDSLLDV
ncbi:RWD domain-containing protein [Entamoeba marina]